MCRETFCMCQGTFCMSSLWSCRLIMIDGCRMMCWEICRVVVLGFCAQSLAPLFLSFIHSIADCFFHFLDREFWMKVWVQLFHFHFIGIVGEYLLTIGIAMCDWPIFPPIEMLPAGNVWFQQSGKLVAAYEQRWWCYQTTWMSPGQWWHQNMLRSSDGFGERESLHSLCCGFHRCTNPWDTTIIALSCCELSIHQPRFTVLFTFWICHFSFSWGGVCWEEK